MRQADYRIKTGYCNGSGDRGRSNLLRGKKNAKHDAIALVYNQIDGLQSKISLLLRQNYLRQRLARFNWLNPIWQRWDLVPFQEPEIVYCLGYLEQALPAIAAYLYGGGTDSKYAIDPEFNRYLESFIFSQQQYVSSPEFQTFSSHLNLARLNQIRVTVRSLESSFSEFDTETRYLELRQVLNRLSSFFWAAIQKERSLLGIERFYWQGTMPKAKKIPVKTGG